MENGSRLPTLYKEGIIIIYAVVVGISFDLSKDILVPVYLIPQNFINSLILFLGYFIVLSSWREYFSSMEKYPHKGDLGFRRFVLDLLILFVFYYIIIIGSKHFELYLIPDIFMYVMPVLFFLFYLWDYFRMKEYPSDGFLYDDKNISLIFLVFFIIMSVSYIFVTYLTGFQSSGQNAVYRDLVFSVLTIFLVVMFRKRKRVHMRNHP